MKSDALTVAAVADYLQTFAPNALAGDWDNVGLLLGDRQAGVRKVMTCLTVTPESAGEAIAAKAQLIVSHHPVLFRPTQRLTRSSPEGRLLLDLIAAGISVYSPHSAFDNTAGGINDAIARRLGLTDAAPLATRRAKQCKIVAFVPMPTWNASPTRSSARRGQIGQYRECSFRLSGLGTFFGTEATNPAVGQKGRRELVDEWRLEVVCPFERVSQAVAARAASAQYESPPTTSTRCSRRGGDRRGRVGKLPKPMALSALVKRVKSARRRSRCRWWATARSQCRRWRLGVRRAGEFLRDAGHAADVFLRARCLPRLSVGACSGDRGSCQAITPASASASRNSPSACSNSSPRSRSGPARMNPTR